MGAWSTDFQRALREDDVYAPQFRLLIGTSALSTKVGEWEQDQNKILEIATHAGTSSFSSVDGYSAYGKVAGAQYRFVVGLTDRIQCGAQSITPRKFQYSGMTMSCEVTTFAAEMAMQMPIGTLSRLQVRFMAGGQAAPTPFETIHLGVFDGVKWNGERYSLSFRDALQAAEQRTTDEGTYRSAAKAVYTWFSGIGDTHVTSNGLTGSMTGASLDLTTDYDASSPSRFGHAYKKPEAFGGQDFHYGRLILPATGATHLHNIWAEVKNSSGNDTYVLFHGLFTTGSKMRMGTASSDGTFKLPGYQNGAAVVGGIDAGSTVKQVMVVHGTPVTEIVNTIYTMGYHSEMVCGLFGETIDEATEALNVTDIELTARDWNEQWRDVTTYAPTRDGVIPMVAVFDKESTSGASAIKKRAAKFGCFPRFKMGGYGVGACLLPRFDKRPKGDDTLILQSDIESAEWSQQDPQSRGLYALMRGTDSDHASDSPSSRVSAVNIQGCSPIIPELSVNSSDCSPGVLRGTAFQLFYDNVIFQEWFSTPRELVTLRLCGLRFAHLAPGDRCDIFMGDPLTSGKGFAYGPIDPAPTGGSVIPRPDHILDSLSGIHMPLQGAYTVMSVKVDWIGIKVHLTLSRRVTGPRADFLSTYEGSAMGEMTGLPQRDIDPDY